MGNVNPASSRPWSDSGVTASSVSGVSGDRLSVVLAAMADVDGEAPSVIDRVCVAAVWLLSLSGAGVSLMVDGQLRGSAGVSEPGIAAVQELQLELGEGPCVESWRLGVPVLEPDLADPVIVRWPTFAQASLTSRSRI